MLKKNITHEALITEQG